MCMGVFTIIYICAQHACSVGQKRVLDPLELELQTVVSYHVGAGNRNRDLCSQSPAPHKLQPLTGVF